MATKKKGGEKAAAEAAPAPGTAPFKATVAASLGQTASTVGSIADGIETYNTGEGRTAGLDNATTHLRKAAALIRQQADVEEGGE